MSILVEDQLEIVVSTKRFGIIVLEALYNNESLHWEWNINGIDTGHIIYRYEADALIRNKRISAKIVLKTMINDIKRLNDKKDYGVESKQIRHQPFKNRYTIELIKTLAIDIYPELVI